MKNTPLTRRRFLQSSPAAAVAMGAANTVLGANDEIVLGVIGTGGRGQRLLKAITNIPGYRVAAVCDLIGERRDRAAEICEAYKPAVRKYEDFRTMLLREPLDACIVATEEGNHAKCSIPVLESGIHCFCEKPVDISVEAVDAVTLAARRAKGIYQVGFQRRYVPKFLQCIRHIHDGHVGKVTFLQGMWQWTGGISPRYLNNDLAGGWFLAQACHHADVMAWVMAAPPLRCAAMGAITVKYPNPPLHCSEDHSALCFEFPGGTLFSYTHLMHCCEQFTGEKLWVYAEKAGIDLPMGMKYPVPGEGEPERLGEESPDWDEGTYEELEAFAQHIRNGETPLANIETGRVSTLMGIMGRMAMYNRSERVYEPRVIEWCDLESVT